MTRKRSATERRARRESVPASPEPPRAALPAAQPRAPSRTTPLGAPELEELWRGYLAARARARPQPGELERWRNALLLEHLPLVRFVAERLARRLPVSVQVDDLVSAGTFGLMDALKGFDPARAVRFKTYAATRVRGAILDSLRSDDWVPRLVRLRATQLERALARLRASSGREPTLLELAAELDLEPDAVAEELARARPLMQHPLSDRPLDALGEGEHVPGLEDPRARTPLEQLIGRETLRAMRGTLSHKERFILEQYYETGHTLREIGELLGLTESRVCQIHTNILGRLRAHYQRRLREEQG